MRTFANFLFLGNLFTTCPTDNKVIHGAYLRIFKPSIKIVEEDCKTKLGEKRSVVTTGLQTVGYIELDNSDTPIVPTRLQYLTNTLNKSKVRIRTLSSCTSEGGICRKCLWSSYKYVNPSFERRSITLVSQYPSISTIPAVGSSFNFDFTGADSALFLSFLVNGYSGSLLGMKSYMTENLPINPVLYRSYLNDDVVSFIQRQVEDTGLVPRIALSYAEKIDDNLERTLYLLSQYIVGYYTSQS